MKVTLMLILFIALCHNIELVKVRVKGGWLKGEKRRLSTGLGTLYSFKGIPYADPPVGKLRFKDPLPHRGWKGMRDATQFGPICIQFDHFGQPYVAGNENCLYLNVYTPSLTPAEPLATIVSIHEGGWRWGSGDDKRHGPDFLVSHNVIVVTFNYRLAALGYLNLENKEVPGNAGMKDQVYALRWVRDNIKYFGGNPDAVTLLGESSGGVSVVYHMMSSMTKGLFKRVISMSGVPLCDFALPFEPRQRAFALGKVLGAKSNDEGELLKYLQSLPAAAIVTAEPSVLTQEQIWKYNTYKMSLFVPTPEKDFGQERFLEDSTIETMKKGIIQDTDLLIGYTDKEHLLMVLLFEVMPFVLKEFNQYREMLIPREILLKLPPEKIEALGYTIHQRYFGNQTIGKKTMANLLSLLDDHNYTYNIHRFLNYMPKRTSKTYLYKFFTVSKRNRYSIFGEKYGIHGCCHSDDLRYLYQFKTDILPVNIFSTEYKLINQSCLLITNFAKWGNPTPDSSLPVKWLPFDKHYRNYLKIDHSLTPDTDADADAVSWWRELYKKHNMELP